MNEHEIDALLAVPGPEVHDLITTVADHAPALFTWNYQKGERIPLNKLYEKAKSSQWNGETALDWSTPVDPEALAFMGYAQMKGFLDDPSNADLPTATWGEKEWVQMGIESQRWMLSQFLHGEQGALVCTAKIVETVPWIDAKYYAATQVMDEARHVEVFAKYLDSKLEGSYPVNPHLWALLQDIVNDSRWDMTYLGMQIMVEGLALAAFGMMHAGTSEPLLKELLRYVMSDEARHVAFGVLTLKEVYADMTAAELRERQEFAYDAAMNMRDRLQQQEVWETMGIDPKVALMARDRDPGTMVFQQFLFSKIVPNLSKLGLLDAGDGWLRTKFGELGVLHMEHNKDTSDEYEAFALGRSDLEPTAAL